MTTNGKVPTLLPTEKTPKKKGFSGRPMLLYGPTKIGKSTFCSQIPNALFIATEAGLSDLEVFQIRVKNWTELLAVAAEVASGEHKFETVVIDTIDNAFRFCSEFVCAREGIAHESEYDFGKGWSMVSGEFRRVITKLSLLPYGLWMIAHSTEKTMKERTGPYPKTVPNLTKGGTEVVTEMADMILFCDFQEVRTPGGEIEIHRVIRTKANKFYEAGSRTTVLPDPLPLDYQAFVKAFEEPPPPIEKKTKPKETAGGRVTG